MMMTALFTPSVQNLPQDELLDISQLISRQFAPQLASASAKTTSKVRLSSQALQDISSEISRDFSASNTQQAEQLVLMAVDPEHVHAYWQLDETTTVPSTTPLTLRIFSQSNTQPALADNSLWYDAKIHGRVRQQTITLPLSLTQGDTLTQYRAELGNSNAAGDWQAVLSSNALAPTTLFPAEHTVQTRLPTLSSAHLSQRPAPELS